LGNKAILQSVLHYAGIIEDMAKDNELARIIDDCKKGSAEGFSRLIDIYAGRLYGYFYRLSGNREISNDLLSELFVKLVEKIGTYKGGCFDSWLFRIASNIFNDYLREKQRYKKILEVRKERLESNTFEAKKSEDDKIDKLQIQLDKLDADTKKLILLRYYSQLSFKDIAMIRAEPVGTTLSKLHRGLKKLRGLMEQ
jgi:RNA polymerase sigma-70 factor (ECF subfamily)